MYGGDPTVSDGFLWTLPGEGAPGLSIGEMSFSIRDPVDLAHCLSQSTEPSFAFAEQIGVD
jgi:hypothetical protein